MIPDLYEHQRLAIEELRPGSILCGGVGSGKSRTALAYWKLKVCGKKDIPIYVITTPKKRDSGDWENEAFLFGVTDLVVDSWNNIKKYVNIERAFFIFDEQRVIGSGVWVKSFLKIAKYNKWILLSATPGDTWMDYIPVFIANGFYRNRTEFIRKHVVYSRSTRYPKVERYLGEKELQRQKERVIVLMKYNHPTKIHTCYNFVGYDRAMYTTVVSRRWNPYSDVPIAEAGSLCYVLRMTALRYPERFEKTKKIVEERKRVVIFYNYVYELDILRRLDEVTTVAEWNGQKHEPVPTCEEWAYLVQYAAGAEAWECTMTDTMLFYSPCYSYKAMAQAAGRIDRLNTPYKDLYYYYFMCECPIEKSVLRALKEKRDFNFQAFMDEKNFLL